MRNSRQGKSSSKNPEKLQNSPSSYTKPSSSIDIGDFHASQILFFQNTWELQNQHFSLKKKKKIFFLK